MSYLTDILYEDFLNKVEENNFTGYPHVDTWDLKDEYSHNEIDEVRPEFIEKVNKYFKEHNLNYTMREIIENAWVCDLDGNIIR